MAPRLPERIPGRFSVVIVAVVALVATGLLVRTERRAASIHESTSTIAATSRGINGYTDSLMQLERTNELAARIGAALALMSRPTGRIDDRSARIAELLTTIRTSTMSIDTSTDSIDRSAGTIRTGLVSINADTATINTRVGGLNTDAARILVEMTRIQRGVRLINSDLTATARVVDAILADARNILTVLRESERLAGCIDRGLNGGGQCPARGGR